MYQALYRKWRPRSFDDVVGQAHITETLKRQVESGRLSHAYLFVGTRGTGKTTCAKILSRAVNCENPQGGNPCNKCRSCLGIENGTILDVEELDAASNNGVDNVRTLREEAIYTPASVKKRVYIIDEVHMLSTAAFNALLKILEEPPAHLIFILATTEIHKVPATILSRCQRFSFKRIHPEDITKRLGYIAEEEGLSLTGDAAELLARMADGGLRDALSLLDQCAADQVIDRAHVLSAIGLAGSSEIENLFSAIMNRDAAQTLTILGSLYTAGKSMPAVLEELMDLERDILITKISADKGTGLLSGNFDTGTLCRLADEISAHRLISGLDIMRETLRELARSTGAKLAVELCLIKLCDETLADGSAALSARIDAIEDRLAGGIPAAAPIKTAAAAEKPAAVQKPAPAAAAEPYPDIPFDFVPPAAKAAKPEPKSEPTPAPRQAAPAQPAATAAVPAGGDLWPTILKAIKNQIDLPPYTFLEDSTHSTAEISGSTLTIYAKNPFAMQMIDQPNVTTALKRTAEAVLGQPVIVKITDQPKDDGPNLSKLDALSRFSNIKFE